jgi:outer membrane protein, heavy metal efflux system
VRTAMFALLVALVVPLHAADDAVDVASLYSRQHQHRSDVRPMTLAEIESVALGNNPEIKLAVRRISLAEAGVPAAGTLDDPEFSYRAWGTPLARPWDLNQAQQMFMLSRKLPARGVRPLEKQVAASDVDIRRAELETMRRDVQARIRAAFYALLRNTDELRLHDEQVAIAQQSIESARIKYTVGKVAQQDVLKAQLATTKLVEHLVMLEQDGDLARATLDTLMGRDPATPVEVQGEYSRSTALPTLAELEANAMKSRPELAGIAAQMKQAELKVELARKGLSPEFAVSGGYMLMPEGTMRRNAYMAELSITLPGANKEKHNAAIAQAQADVETLRAEFDARRTAVFGEIQQALVRANATAKLVRLYSGTLVPQSQSAFRASVAAYQNDHTDLLNLLESQNTILDARTAAYRAQADYDNAKAELERAVGADVMPEVKP